VSQDIYLVDVAVPVAGKSDVAVSRLACGCGTCDQFNKKSPPATTHISTWLLFFALRLRFDLSVRSTTYVVGDHFVLFEFDWSDQSRKCKLTWQPPRQISAGEAESVAISPAHSIPLSLPMGSRILYYFLQRDPNLLLLARYRALDFILTKLRLPSLTEKHLRPNKTDQIR
jgi:hypothetical protein